MQVTETLSDGLKREYAVVVPAADIESRRLARLTSLGKQIRLPGFRPGKVPMGVVKQRYGVAVAAEIADEQVNEATRKIVEDNGLRPALQPKIEGVDADAAKASPAVDLSFKIEMEILPEIPMPDFGAIALTRLKAEVAPEKIDEALNMMATRSRTLSDLTEEDLAARGENQGAIDGDVLTVDFVGKIDGEVFEGGSANDIDVDIGGSGFIPGFAEQLVGAKAGEARTISVTFPADYGAAHLAGKDATFDVTVKQHRKAVPTPIDDTLAQKMGLETLDELRTGISERIQADYDRLSRLRLKRSLLDALTEVAQFPVPESMATMEFDQIWQRIEADKAADKLDEADKGKDDETLRAEYRAIAERRVRLGLLLSEIGRINGISVSADEMNRAMRAQAAQYPGQEAQMMELFRKYPAIAENVRGPIQEDKVVDFVLELAKVSDEIISIEELQKDPDEATPTATEPAATE